MSEVAPRLDLRDVVKRFGALTAVAPLSLTMRPGSIHGLLGENGAGKTTLVRMVAGELRPDHGTIAVDGRVLPGGDARAARAAGVGVVHQHFALVGALSVAENLALGRFEAATFLTSPRQVVAAAERLSRQHHLDIGDPRRRSDGVAVGTQARIEILRALSGAPRVLLLDEPTAVLTPAETTELFASLRRLRTEGILVVFITHKLEEALALCDTVSVMGGGRLLATFPRTDVSATRLAALMVGAGTTATPPRPEGRAVALPSGRPALTLREVTTPAGGAARTPLDRITLRVAAGEICGIAGVDGNGQEELAAALCGYAPRSGTVAVAGVEVRPGDVAAAQAAGLALIPPDRRRDGLAATLAVWENSLLAAPLLRRFTRRARLDVAAVRRFAGRLAREYRITPADVDQPAAALSGGNQQRLVVARALALRPKALVAVNPTRGLDIAAAAQVRALLVETARAGAAVLVISTDLDELADLSDRVFVLFRGRLVGSAGPGERDEIGAMMAGLAPQVRA